jgi:hypothetical protein
MSIRMVAVELYQSMKEVGGLEKELGSLEAGSQERVETETRLREARTRVDRLKKMVEGAKGD